VSEPPGDLARYAAFTSLQLDRPQPDILRLTMAAKGRLNAASAEMHTELARIWQEIDRDTQTRCVLVRGSDGAFSAGGDF